jgi:poly-gamma-glutamate synthesis protein (capsule biosynthesis protein)
MIRTTLSYLAVLAVLLSGCSTEIPAPLAPSDLPTATAVVTLQPLSTLTPSSDENASRKEFVGRVIDMNGDPVQGAQVESVDNSAGTDRDGWFRLSAGGLPRWLKVSAPGFLSRTRAAAPGIPVLFRLTPDDGKTIVLHFAGDTMFGRRFFDSNGDGQLADGLLPPTPSVNDHMKLFAPVRPLLENADFTIVNFESTLSEQPYFSQIAPRPADFHPTAPSVYASHPNSVLALKESGVDIVDLGNNHMYDLLEAGLHKTLSAFHYAGLLHFGAGLDEASAWEPLIVSSKGQSIAFIGCTTLRIPLGTPIRNDIPYVASDVRQKGGAAYCAEGALRSAIVKAKQQANAVIVMIHGGREYDRTPTLRITYLSEVARQAGATLIINHHTHVVSGFRQRGQTLVAWSMGNFFYDQTVWPSLESYLLAIHLREGIVVRAYVEPLVIDGFVPHGLTGEMADYVIRGAAGRETGPFVMESGAMEVDLAGQALQNTHIETMDGGSSPGQILAIPQAQWISGFTGPGKLLQGRDLLWVGGFENDEIDSKLQGAPLWEVDPGKILFGPEYAYAGELGIHLERDGGNKTDDVTNPLRRVFVVPRSNLSITGMVRLNQGAVAMAQLNWYADSSGPSILKTIRPIEVVADHSWQAFRLDVQVPANAAALGLYLRLRLPGPEEGKTMADFDNVRIIEWQNAGAQYSPLYNFALLTGTGDITFTQEYLPGAESWTTVSAFQRSK